MKNWPWFIISLVVVFFDQITKYWALTHLMPYQPEALIPMVNFTLAYNTGAAFSFLHSSGQWHLWFFMCFSFVMSVVIAVWMTRILPKARLQLIGSSLILGGALGNLIDRVRIGSVVDFIELYYQNYHFPIFNLADSAICLAAFILALDLLKNSKTQ